MCIIGKKMNLFEVKVTAKKIRRRKILFRVTSVVTSISIVLLLAFYGIVHLSNSLGAFTVILDDIDKNKSMSLSEEPTFKNPTTALEGTPMPDMDNTTEAWLPDDVNDIDGAHNGFNFIAYTFYLKNVGLQEFDYSSSIDILAVSQRVDDAIRVKVYKNGDSTVYAKRQRGSNEPEPNTTPFYSDSQVMNVINEGLQPDNMDKYTIVIWIEGNDPECLNDLLGGRMKLRMRFNIISDKEKN